MKCELTDTQSEVDTLWTTSSNREPVITGYKLEKKPLIGQVKLCIFKHLDEYESSIISSRITNKKGPDGQYTYSLLILNQ